MNVLFKKQPDWQRERALRLHRICAEIKEREALGETLHQIFGKILRREKRRRANGRPLRLSKSRLYSNYSNWEKNPSPLAFQLNYRSGNSCPTLLLREYLRRCFFSKTRSTNEVYASLLRDWNELHPIRGIGTWQTWARRTHAEITEGVPAFPFSRRTFTRRFSQRDLAELHKLRASSNVVSARLRREFEQSVRAIAAYELAAFERIANGGSRP